MLRLAWEPAGAFIYELMCFLLLAMPLVGESSRAFSPDLTLGEVRSLLDHDNFAAAENLLKASLIGRPSWQEAHLLLARTYLDEHRFVDARTESLNAFNLRQSLDAFLVLATVSMEMNRLNESIGWLQRGSDVFGERSEIYRLLGFNYALGGMMKESAAAFQAAAKLDSTNWEYAYLEGRALTELGQLSHAEAALRNAASLGGPVVKIETALGQVYERAHRDDEAEQSYRRAISSCNTDDRACAWPLLDLGILISREHGFAEAEPMLKRAVHAYPEFAKAHFYLGKALAANHDREHACAEFENAVRLEGNRPEYHYDLAQMYRELGRAIDAEHEFARFRETAAAENGASAGVDFR